MTRILVTKMLLVPPMLGKPSWNQIASCVKGAKKIWSMKNCKYKEATINQEYVFIVHRTIILHEEDTYNAIDAIEN